MSAINDSSKVEEAIAALHWIVAVLCFAYGFNAVAWIFAVRAGLDEICAVSLAFKSIFRAHRNVSEGVLK